VIHANDDDALLAIERAASSPNLSVYSLVETRAATSFDSEQLAVTLSLSSFFLSFLLEPFRSEVIIRKRRQGREGTRITFTLDLLLRPK